MRELEAALETFVDQGDAPRAAAAVASAAVSCQRSFTRVWSLD